MECCRVDDTSPEHTIIVLPAGWVDTDVSRLYISINHPQPGGSWAPSRSPPVTWWPKTRTDSSIVILHRIYRYWWCTISWNRIFLFVENFASPSVVAVGGERFVDGSPDGVPFAAICLAVRVVEAFGAAALITSSFAIIANTFPDNVTAMFVRALP